MANKLNLSNEDVALIMAGRLIINKIGCRYYYDTEKRLHRDNGPAIIWADGSTSWYRHGKQSKLLPLTRWLRKHQ